MRKGVEKYYSPVPNVGLRDHRFLSRTSWDHVDAVASSHIGAEWIGIPSVRVGIGWTLEYLGYRRHLDHILVPRFMGRCILNCFNRYALPVEASTPETRLAVVVHQFGLMQDLDAIQRESESKGLFYVEDSPYGLDETEKLGPGSLAKFIGFTKILPVLKGALVTSRDGSLIEFLKNKRQESSLWSWPVFAALGWVRKRRKAGKYSALADAAYEMYVECRGDNPWLRGNFAKAFGKLDAYAVETQRRLSMIEGRIKHQVLLPHARRVGYTVPYFPISDETLSQEAFNRNGFDPGFYHVDVARNLFHPNYQRCLLIPLNAKVPLRQFANLVDMLGDLNADLAATESPDFMHPAKV